MDFGDLNQLTPKHEYPMPFTDDLIDKTARHSLMSYMDYYSRYNHIFITEENVHKMAFRCSMGIFEWVVMPFDLKNMGATYQQAINTIFHELLGRIVKVYIDDIIVKFKQEIDQISLLSIAFERMRFHKLKLNLMKCAFGVQVGQFIGFVIYYRAIKID